MIVVAVDLSEYSDAVLTHAFDQAARMERPAVHILAVVSDEHGLWHRPTEAELSEREDHTKAALVVLARRVLDDAVPAVTREHWNVRLHVRRGHPDEQIVELTEQVMADLLVIGRYGHSRRRLGSIADRVLAQAECPVLVVSAIREHSATDRQCPDCVVVRADSSGEEWFCPAHHGGRASSTVVRLGSNFARGGW
ncbi:MAG: universal stress protein [Myxococcales bacterium]|nr:universal stress protein [Myxococcales bacterium]